MRNKSIRFVGVSIKVVGGMHELVQTFLKRSKNKMMALKIQMIVIGAFNLFASDSIETHLSYPVFDFPNKSKRNIFAN